MVDCDATDPRSSHIHHSVQTDILEAMLSLAVYNASVSALLTAALASVPAEL